MGEEQADEIVLVIIISERNPLTTIRDP